MKLSDVFNSDEIGKNKLKDKLSDRWNFKPAPYGVGVNRVQQAPSGPDITPNPLNWQNISYSYVPVDTYIYTTQQVTGINASITLRIQYSTVPANSFFLYYKIDSISPTYNPAIDPLAQGFTIALNNAVFNVTNNQYITFGVEPSVGWDGVTTINATVTIRNVTDSNAILDTFIAEIRENN
jgi:hypothetical protein